MGHTKASEYAKNTDIKYLFVTDEGIFMNDGMREAFTKSEP